MKSCVSLHRFRINADPPGGGFNLGNYGDGLRPSVLSAPACSVPQRAQCPSSKKLRFSSLDGLRPIIRPGKSSAYVQAQRI